MGVNTVCGVIDANDLGKTLMHEHFMFGQLGYMGDISMGPYNKEDALKVAQGIADAVRPFGVKTIVDATPNENGRDAAFLKEASELTGLNIVCPTGFYFENAGASPYWNERRTFIKRDIRKEMTELFVKEITEGVAGTGIRAGIIKIGSNAGAFTPFEEALFKAAAAAQKETGAPITTHTQAGTMGPEQADLLIAEGADPEKIIIGHMDASPNIAYQLEVLKRGVYVGFDQMGLQAPNWTTNEERFGTLAGLLALGYANRITMSHDTVNYWLGRPREYPPELAKSLENYHVAYVNGGVIPRLHAVGFSEETTNQIVIENPKKLLDMV